MDKIDVLLDTMAIMMVVDGEIAEEEETMLRRIYEKVSGNKLSPEMAQDAVERAKTQQTKAVTHLMQIRFDLTPKTREMIMEAAFDIARADNEMRKEEKTMLRGYGQALGLDYQDIEDLFNNFWEGIKKPTIELD